jgi:hypothetical protein
MTANYRRVYDLDGNLYVIPDFKIADFKAFRAEGAEIDRWTEEWTDYVLRLDTTFGDYLA